MKKVTDLKENEYIHCVTKEDFKAILELNPKNDCQVELWGICKDETIYYPKGDDWGGGIRSLRFAKDKNYTIHPASDFLQPTYQLTKSQIIAIAENGSLVKELFPECFETTPIEVIKLIEVHGKDKLITLIEAYDNRNSK